MADSTRLKKEKDKKQVVRKSRTPVKKIKSLSGMEERTLLTVLDNESTAVSFDEQILKNIKLLKLDKDLVIEFLVKQFRELERKHY